MEVCEYFKETHNTIIGRQIHFLDGGGNCIANFWVRGYTVVVGKLQGII